MSTQTEITATTTNTNQQPYRLPPIQTAYNDYSPPNITIPPLTPPPWPPAASTQSHSKSKSNNRKQRSSHSMIEKRRREKMNDKIERLKKLIPACTPQFPFSVQQPIQKLSVLQAAIDYIQELHHQLQDSLPKDDPLLKELSTVLYHQQ